jgi:hypothetical protein
MIPASPPSILTSPRDGQRAEGSRRINFPSGSAVCWRMTDARMVLQSSHGRACSRVAGNSSWPNILPVLQDPLFSVVHTPSGPIT